MMDLLSSDLVVEQLCRRTAPAGAFIYREGDVARELFILVRGEVELTKQVAGGRARRLRLVRRADSFGDMSLLDLQPRGATARARCATTMLVLPYAGLLRIQQADPQTFTLLIMNIAREVARRLREVNHTLSRAPGDREHAA
jgi:CRP/FNR family transcriptional regulator, cyclic AMP receptor protein